MAKPLTGRCVCGGVRYEIGGTPRPVWNCHCHRCRRWTGHFMAATNCEYDDFTLIEDATLHWHHPADDPNVAYGSCRECGSSLFWRVVEPPAEGPYAQTRCMWICAGTLDPPTGLRSERAIFAAAASDYHTLDPNLETRPWE